MARYIITARRNEAPEHQAARIYADHSRSAYSALNAQIGTIYADRQAALAELSRLGCIVEPDTAYPTHADCTDAENARAVQTGMVQFVRFNRGIGGQGYRLGNGFKLVPVR